MGIDEDESEMEKIHRGGDARIGFEFYPGTLHVFGIMDIIDSYNAFLGQPVQQKIRVPLRCFIRMVRIDICYIYMRGRICRRIIHTRGRV